MGVMIAHKSLFNGASALGDLRRLHGSAHAVAPAGHEARKRSGATNRRTEVKRRAVELS